jgi:hypothetical protein
VHIKGKYAQCALRENVPSMGWSDCGDCVAHDRTEKLARGLLPVHYVGSIGNDDVASLSALSPSERFTGFSKIFERVKSAQEKEDCICTRFGFGSTWFVWTAGPIKFKQREDPFCFGCKARKLVLKQPKVLVSCSPANGKSFLAREHPNQFSDMEFVGDNENILKVCSDLLGRADCPNFIRAAVSDEVCSASKLSLAQENRKWALTNNSSHKEITFAWVCPPRDFDSHLDSRKISPDMRPIFKQWYAGAAISHTKYRVPILIIGDSHAMLQFYKFCVL